eukprot:403356774
MVPIANSHNDMSQDRFQIYSDSKFGMQYSGQRSFHDSVGNRFINQRNFFVDMWFYTCIPDSFVLFTVQERDGPSSTVDNDFNFLSIGVQGDGYIYLEIRLVDNEANVAYKEKTTNMQVKTGWNYVALLVDEIYEFSYVYMYHRSENHASPTIYTKYYTYFKGFYDETEDDEAASKDVVLVLGCKDYITYATSPLTDESPYGLCMRGWIQYMNVYTHASQVASVTSMEGFITTWINSGANLFQNSRKGLIFSTITITQTQMFVFDTTVTSFGVNKVTTSATNYYTCAVDLSTGRTYNPFYQPSIGRITTNATQYFQCTLTKINANTLVSFFPAMFTMEAWFRFDPIDLRPNGYISQVFALYDNGNYKLGFGVSNTFLRIYLDDTIHDIHFLFNETTDYWHYVAISYVRLFERQTRIYVYLDDIHVLTTDIFDWFIYNPATVYAIHIANNFPGIVRKAKINARPYCLNDKSLWINTDETKCIKKGDRACTFCDIDETGVTAGTYNCFYNCEDFGYYISGTTCTECHKGCRYCKSAATSSDCYLCNKTNYFNQDYTKTALTDTAALKNANRITCNCSAGTITMGGGDKCMKCDSRCAVCTDILNVNCDSCADGAYKVYRGKCETKCPTNYVKDDDNRICNFDKSKTLKQKLPDDPQGCIDGFYWSWEYMNCSACHYSCNTCEYRSGYCTTCPVGRYLTMSNTCDQCESFLTNSMLVGTDGNCVETCGDGKRFDLTGCDDGNTKGGDGCSSTCKAETGFICRQGTYESKDTCTYLPTELVGADINKYNDIILNFSRPVNFTRGSIDNSDLKLFYKNQNGDLVTIKYKALAYNQPSNYLYIKTYFEEDIFGGAVLDQLLKIQYQNTNSIKDINGREIKQSTYARVWINTYNFFPAFEKQDAELYGKLTLGFIFAALSFWGTISQLTGKTIIPAVTVFLGFQVFFYIGCQDLYLDQKTRYFFTFFRIFRLEHAKFENFFLENNWLELNYLKQQIYNMNFYPLGELQYQNFLINNNLKIYLFYSYFFTMPLILLIDFVITQCMADKRLFWFQRYIANQYFFGGPMMMLYVLAILQV